MTYQFEATTELEAVNEIIGTIGMTPVNSLTGALTSDISTARNTLRSVIRTVCTKGWHFNTEHDWPLLRDVNGHITLPGNIVGVDIDDPAYSDIEAVQRGQRLYDKKGHTYTFNRNLKATVVILLPFEELPQSARDYCMMFASRRFQAHTVGSAELEGFTETDELNAWIAFKEAEGDTADLSIFTNEDQINFRYR